MGILPEEFQPPEAAAAISHYSQAPDPKQEKFRLETDGNGRQSLIHQGSNRSQRRQAKAIQTKSFKKAMKRLKAKAAEARKLAAQNPTAEDPNVQPEIVEIPEEG
jgi:hypothetical protein